MRVWDLPIPHTLVPISLMAGALPQLHPMSLMQTAVLMMHNPGAAIKETTFLVAPAAAAPAPIYGNILLAMSGNGWECLGMAALRPGGRTRLFQFYLFMVYLFRFPCMPSLLGLNFFIGHMAINTLRATLRL